MRRKPRRKPYRGSWNEAVKEFGLPLITNLCGLEFLLEKGCKAPGDILVSVRAKDWVSFHNGALFLATAVLAHDQDKKYPPPQRGRRYLLQHLKRIFDGADPEEVDRTSGSMNHTDWEWYPYEQDD